MTFSKFSPVALMVALFAAGWVYAGNYFGLVLWVPFISWPMYFAFDPGATKPLRIPKEVMGLSGGIVFGYLTLVVAPILGNLFGGTLGLPATVFLVAFTIVMLELTNWFELAPAYFFAYAGYFAYVFGGFGGPLGEGGSLLMSAAVNSLVPYWLLIMLGLAIGYVTALLRRKLLEREGVFGGAQQTVFDKETPNA